jgi:hypothetical protein
MTRRTSGKEVMTLEVYKDTYDLFKKAAEERRYNTKEYMNTILKYNLMRLEFLQRQLPNLSIDSCDDGRITLKDSKEMKLIVVYFVAGEFRCELDKSTNCIHTKFVWASPEVRLNSNGNASEPEKERGQKKSKIIMAMV